MLIKQISVFVENKEGRLHKLTELLGKNGIDFVAMCIADTTDFGIMRCIVKDPDKALAILRENGYAASTAYVLGVEVPDHPGGMSEVLALLAGHNMPVEYLYSFVRSNTKGALILLKVERIEEAEQLFLNNGVHVLSESDIYSLN